ncbi:MAG: hypothetical protein ACPGTU_13410 [Myxococcota bacterium]
MRVDSIVQGLVEGLLISSSGGAVIPVAQTTAVLIRKVDQMPRFMRFGMRVLLVVFNYYGVLRAGRRFHTQSIEQKRLRIDEWSRAPLGPCRDMVEFFRKMGTFVCWSLLEKE